MKCNNRSADTLFVSVCCWFIDFMHALLLVHLKIHIIQ